MNFWGMIIGGIANLIKGLVLNQLPVHEPLNLVANVLQMASSGIGLIFTVGLILFDMTIPMIAFGAIVAMEIARTIYVVWLRIKHLVL